MIYDYSNSIGATVFDVDIKNEIKNVISINTDAMTVTCAEYPLRVVGNGVSTFDTRYRSIYVIQGREKRPCLFHCYGKIK